ncbi:MAG: GntR family transcriptional regulator [Streptococcaceae bacterium]|jgi:DNA-binding transcriptional regulator YhcF (GntR family)|nr:GntR family transcriptional regulator [Streptococcaceae bacterium]
MMEIDFIASTPIYQQIRDQIILALASGDLQFGDELPSVRSMSDEIGVNSMTVSKAYQLLKDDGIAEGDRRKGTKIVDQIRTSDRIKEQIRSAFILLTAECAIRGISSQELKDLIDQIYKKNQGV